MSEGEELTAVDALLRSMTSVVQRREALGDEARSLAEAAFRGSSRLEPVERIGIYREQFWLRHLDSLKEDFPGTSRILGAAWDETARQYLTQHPPKTPSLRELGFELPDYLATLSEKESPRIAVDMAKLERAYLEVFDAPDEAPLDPARVAQLEPEEWLTATLRVSGALRLLELDFPVAELRRGLRAEEPAPKPEPAPRRHCLAVYRRELGLWDQEIAEEACDLLRRLAAGVPLAEACEATASALPAAGSLLDTRLGEWFGSWSRLGWISEIVAASAP